MGESSSLVISLNYFVQNVINPLYSANFDYKLTFDTADRQTFAKIVEFCELLDWDVSPEIENKKANELHNWFTLYQKFIKEIFNVNISI